MHLLANAPSRTAAAFAILACALAATPLRGQVLPSRGDGVDLEMILANDSVIASSGLPGGWFRAQYLMWWTDGTTLPALVTTSPDGTLRDQAGVLGTPGAEVLFGNQTIHDEMRHGVRLSMGLWRDDAQTWGLQADWFLATEDDDANRFGAASNGGVILARPFFNAVTGQQDADLIAFPNVVTGAINVSTDSELHSGALHLRGALRCGPNGRLDILGGYRYLRYGEELRIDESLVSIDPQGLRPPGTTFDLSDRFQTKNDFHGAEIGLTGEFYRSFLAVETSARMAIGNVRERLDVSGGTVVIEPNVPLPGTPFGGFLATSSNIGRPSRDDFAFLPQFDINLKCLLADNLNLTLGYTFLYLSDSLRVGEQIDTSINPTQLTTPEQPGGPLVGAGRPAVFLRDTDFWAQGLSLGAELMW